MPVKSGKQNDKDDDEDDQEESPEELLMARIRFLGAMNGNEVNLAANAKLAQVGLPLAKRLVATALSRGAELMRIEPKGPVSQVALQIDGMGFSGGKLSKQESMATAQMLRLLAGLDPKERAAQTAAIKAEFDGRGFVIKVSTTPTPEGDRVVVQAADSAVKLDTCKDIMMADDMRKRIKEISVRKGVFILTGPAMCGITTTAYAVLRNTDVFVYSFYTIGDTGGRTVVAVPPFEAGKDDPLSFTFERIIRAEADGVFIGDPLKDAETAKTIFEKASEIAVIVEMRGYDVPGAILQLITWLEDPQIVAERLNGVVTQKLLRTLCPECKQAYRPKPEFLKQVGLPETCNTLYRKRPEPPPPDPDPKKRAEEEEYIPCAKCGDLGYKGRGAAFEFLEMTDEMRQLVATKPTAEAIRAQVKKEKQVTLMKDALRLVAEGRTSIEEMKRVFQTTPPAGSGAPVKKAAVPGARPPGAGAPSAARPAGAPVKGVPPKKAPPK